MTPFSFGLFRAGGRFILTVGGDIDGSVVDDFIDIADVALADDACDELAVDLKDVSFLDSTGIGGLLAIRNNAVNLAKGLSLRHVSSNVVRLLTMTGLESLFDIDDDPGAVEDSVAVDLGSRQVAEGAPPRQLDW